MTNTQSLALGRLLLFHLVMLFVGRRSSSQTYIAGALSAKNIDSQAARRYNASMTYVLLSVSGEEDVGGLCGSNAPMI